MNLECFMSTIGVAENKVKEFKGITIKLDITNNTSEQFIIFCELI